MKNLIRNFVMATSIVAVGLSFNSCGDSKKQQAAANGDELSGEISLSGAFALYPLAVKWADEFQKLHPNVKVDISAGGAGKGITDALAQVVDLGMVSRELKPEELKQGALGIAVAKDAVVPTINAKNPALKDILAVGLTREGATRLWIKQDAKTWGELLGTSDKTPINVYNRSDACGAAETWAAWFGKKQEDLNGTGVFGDPGVASAVQKDPNGVGFNNIGYAYDEQTRKPNPGIIVLPLDVNGNGKVDPEEQFYDTKDAVVAAIADGRYPSPPARDLYLVSKGKPTKPEVIAFLEYILKEGQKENGPTGYIALDSLKLQKGLQQLK